MRPGPLYYEALDALVDAHQACYNANTDCLGMSNGPFSGVNRALGLISIMEETIERFKQRDRFKHIKLQPKLRKGKYKPRNKT